MNKKRFVVITLRVIAISIVAYFVWMYYMFFTIESRFTTDFPSESSSISGDLTQLETAISNINDSLPHYQYKKIKDSLEHIKETNKFKNVLYTSGSGNNHYGIYEANQFDSAYFSPTTPVLPQPKTTSKAYYLMLGDYTLNMDHIVFRDNGKNYLKYPVWDKTTKTEDGGTYKTGHYETKEINVAVSELPKKENFVANEKKEIYLPISKKIHSTLNWVLVIFQFLAGALSIYVMLFLPFKILERIAKGDAFNRKNIRALHTIAFTLFAFYLWDIIIPILIYACTKNSIPVEFKFVWSSLLTSGITTLISGIVLLILARTFAKGYRLQQEQELTV